MIFEQQLRASDLVVRFFEASGRGAESVRAMWELGELTAFPMAPNVHHWDYAKPAAVRTLFLSGSLHAQRAACECIFEQEPALGSGVHRHVGALGEASVKLAWPADALRGIVDHLLPMRNPARRAGDGVQHGEHLSRKTERP